MPPQATMTLSFPPFTPWVKRIILANVGVFFFFLIFDAFFPQYKYISPWLFLRLMPADVTHGWVWELFTYGFLHVGVMHLLFNMLSLWMFGSQLESNWGSRRFIEFYCMALVFAAATTVGVSYTGFMGVTPENSTVGASGAIYGLLTAYGILFGDREVFLFPWPFAMRARYLVMILIGVTLYGAIQAAAGRAEGVAYVAHLGGVLFAWLYLRFMPRRGVQFAASEKYFGLRNRYYRWKRRRAARKFEVYMRDQGRKDFRMDDYFDQHGNYRGPGDAPPDTRSNDDHGGRPRGGGPRRVQ